MPQAFIRIFIHVIFSTKRREATISSTLRPRLHSYIAGIISECGGTPMIVNGMADHVHILMALPSNKSVSELVRIIKANSSKWVHELFSTEKGFAWQNGYAVFGVSASNVDEVRRYIEKQEEHHRKRTFAEEYEAFLAKHGFVQHPKDLAA
jgi:REP element-mobilizing transposase RayT